MLGLNSVLNVKAVVAAFNQENALVGAFSVIVNTDCETDWSFYSTSRNICATYRGRGWRGLVVCGGGEKGGLCGEVAVRGEQLQEQRRARHEDQEPQHPQQVVEEH